MVCVCVCRTLNNGSVIYVVLGKTLSACTRVNIDKWPYLPSIFLRLGRQSTTAGVCIRYRNIHNQQIASDNNIRRMCLLFHEQNSCNCRWCITTYFASENAQETPWDDMCGRPCSHVFQSWAALRAKCVICEIFGLSKGNLSAYFFSSSHCDFVLRRMIHTTKETVSSFAEELSRQHYYSQVQTHQESHSLPMYQTHHPCHAPPMHTYYIYFSVTLDHCSSLQDYGRKWHTIVFFRRKKLWYMHFRTRPVNNAPGFEIYSKICTVVVHTAEAQGIYVCESHPSI